MVSKITNGIISSIAPMSLENLFKILPDVFVLKNLIVAFTTPENIRLCILFDALMQKYMNCIDLQRLVNIVTVTSPE